MKVEKSCDNCKYDLGGDWCGARKECNNLSAWEWQPKVKLEMSKKRLKQIQELTCVYCIANNCSNCKNNLARYKVKGE